MKVFIERIKKPESEQLFNVGVTLGKKITKGDIGIEVEVEGKRLPKLEDDSYPVGLSRRSFSART
jgi:hypothetical protein